ncbi:SAVED domain-containing protein [Metabacillus idriensis]|uniref:SAVED domain-containing protein n=1 Tax=Metabacillus idriensis TaxID=324768 RepID=UPI00174ABAA4|nr:SAVED domain-containing protein [Metabacillus idriensis]
MNNLFAMFKKFTHGWYEKGITRTLLFLGGSAISSAFAQDWLRSILIPIANKLIGTQMVYTEKPPNYTYMTIAITVGFGLIGLGLWFYFKTKTKSKKQIMLRIQHSSIEPTTFSNFDTDLSDYDLEPFPINQREELEEVKETNIYHALREQEKVAKKVIQRLNDNDDIEVSYWGLAHIPFLLLLGYQTSDKLKSSFFEWNRHKAIWEKVKQKRMFYPPLKLDKDISKQDVGETKEVVVKIGITYPVTEANLDGLSLEELNSYYLHLDPPHQNAIVCMEQVNKYKEEFRNLLDEINQTYPHLEKIHLFYSGQPSLAYRLGSTISPRMDKEIWVYNFSTTSFPKYNWAINLKKVDQPIDVKITGGN